jgi:hypothetical protein
MTSTLESPSEIESPDEAEPLEDIHASFFTLITATLGLFITAVGLMWIWQNPQSATAVWLEIVGPALLAISATSHIEHLANRIGRLAVVLSIVGAFLWGFSYLPFAINNFNYSVKGWVQLYFAAWGTSFLLFSISLFIVAWHKEDRLEQHDLAKEHVIHVSFSSLLIAAAGGTLIFSAGLYEMAANPTGTRLAWILQAVGPFLIAVAVTTHIGHMAKHIGRLAVILGIVGVFVWALPNIPLAIKPSLLYNPTWGEFLTNGCFGLGYALLGVSALLLVNRKRLLEKHGAVLSW